MLITHYDRHYLQMITLFYNNQKIIIWFFYTKSTNLPINLLLKRIEIKL